MNTLGGGGLDWMLNAGFNEKDLIPFRYPTLDPFDHADCYVYSNFHDILKMYKHGYSKVTDQVCREIRFGRLDREMGKMLVDYYENQPPAYMDLFCNWLGVDERALQFAADRHRNKKYWEEVEPDVWNRRNRIIDVPSSPPQHPSLMYPLDLEDKTLNSKRNKFITIGKGVDWPAETDEKSSKKWI